MKTSSTPITGNETVPDSNSPLFALTQFYTAFNSADFALMQENWLQNDEASMSNPLGGVKRGWPAIESVYRKIFNGPAKVYVEFFDYTIHATDAMFVAVGRETGSLKMNDTNIDLAIRTSRIYIRHDNAWKQVHHHGSMDNPELLGRYQTTLLS